jgi:hypothetical protein
MDNRADNQNSRATTNLSRANRLAPNFLQAAKRARGKALRDMIFTLVQWAKAFSTNRPSRSTVNADAIRATPKR